MAIAVLRYALIGALSIYGVEYSDRFIGTEAKIYNKRNEEIFSMFFEYNFLVQFVFNLDAESPDFIIRIKADDKTADIIVTVPTDCCDSDLEIMLNRLVEMCFIRISIEYKKLLSKE